jgi:antitoxin (DNA-binding transcriptional repressor) of toxin-antitoxin stability system
MKTVTITELRRNIFQLIDEALETGETIVVHRKGRRVLLSGEQAASLPPAETEEERAERWRKFWAEPSEINEDLSVEDIKAARNEYWHWDEEPEIDR